MSAPRIYSQQALQAGTQVVLEGEATNHLRALRLRPGDDLVLFDGQGGEYPAQLQRLERRQAEVSLAEHAPREAESPLPVTLLQGVSKGSRMDWTIQKAVELGVSRIVPVFTARSVVRLADERLQKKLTHWRGVIVSACEQSGRNQLPALDTPMNLQEALAASFPGLRCLLDPADGRRLSELQPDPGQGVVLLVGPEGGLSDEELTGARRHAYQPVLFGPRVLRTETAGITALAAFQTLWGDLG